MIVKIIKLTSLIVQGVSVCINILSYSLNGTLIHKILSLKNCRKPVEKPQPFTKKITIYDMTDRIELPYEKNVVLVQNSVVIGSLPSSLKCKVMAPPRL